MNHLTPRLEAAIKEASAALHSFDLQQHQPEFPAVPLGAITLEQIRQKRAELFALGINLRELCDVRGISYQAARELLCGKAIGRRGAAHKAAVALGLKPDPSVARITPGPQ